MIDWRYDWPSIALIAFLCLLAAVLIGLGGWAATTSGGGGGTIVVPVYIPANHYQPAPVPRYQAPPVRYQAPPEEEEGEE